ncbi:MAG: HAMP domain-containing sensor histidine kinase [Oceanicaulis sp.]
MERAEISRLDGRFADRALEADYQADAWPIQRLQTGLTVFGLSAAFLLTLQPDFEFLRGTIWFLPTAGLRALTGLTGLALFAWIWLGKPAWPGVRARALLRAWLVLCLLTCVTVANAYPPTEPTDQARHDVLVFTAYWMCVFAIAVGYGFFSMPRMVALFSAGLALCYLELAIVYRDSALYPKVTQTVLVLATCSFAWIMAMVRNFETRRRFHVTQLYEAAKRSAEKSEELQTFLLAATGHDIRQPVYALDLNASALEAAAEAGDVARVQALARRQRLVARNVTSMLSSILQLSTMDAGRARAEPRTLSASALLHAAVDPLREFAAERGLAIRVVETNASVSADPGVAGHVLANLAANAMAHSGGTRLVCGARRRGGQVELWLADDGAGLCLEPMVLRSMEDLRLSEGAGRVRAGLGMEIMFRLAERGGLTLEIASNPGRGVCARLVCPAGSP